MLAFPIIQESYLVWQLLVYIYMATAPGGQQEGLSLVGHIMYFWAWQKHCTEDIGKKTCQLLGILSLVASAAALIGSRETLVPSYPASK